MINVVIIEHKKEVVTIQCDEMRIVDDALYTRVDLLDDNIESWDKRYLLDGDIVMVQE